MRAKTFAYWSIFHLTRGFTQEEVVAREGAQNSLDAGKNVRGVTQLEFHVLKVDGTGKSDLLSLLELDDLLSPRREAFRENPANEYFANSVDEFSQPTS